MELSRFFDLIELMEGIKYGLSGDYTKIPESFKAEEIENSEDFAKFLKDISENSDLIFGDTLFSLYNKIADSPPNIQGSN